MKTAKTNKPPEAFFRDRQTVRQQGMVFISDPRISNWEDLPNGKRKWIPHYAFPTEEAKEIARGYPMGDCIVAIEIFKRPDGNLLTVLRKSCGSAGFIVDVWAGLTDANTEPL